MPQNTVAVTTVSPVNVTGLQEQINLGAAGNMVCVGSPGGPVVFATLGAMIVPALFGGAPRSIVGSR